MWNRRFKPGDCVVYRKSKHTANPGRRAQEVRACPKGDNYTYFVDKFWIVRRVMSSGHLLVATRRGKTHVIDQKDPNLRRPTTLQRVRHRNRFSQLQALEA